MSTGIGEEAATLQRIATAFGLGRVDGCSRYSRGQVNDSWRIRTGGFKWVVRRVSAVRARSDVAFEHAVLAFLHAEPIAYQVPVPLAVPEGETTVEQGGRLFWIYPYIPGRTGAVVDSRTAGNVAEAMATLHHYLCGAPLRPARSDPSPFDSAWLAEVIEASLCEPKISLRSDHRYAAYRRYMRAALAYLVNLEGGAHGALARFPLHYDWHPDNLVCRGGRITGILDFDNCRVGAAVDDIAIFLSRNCLMGRGGRASFDFGTARAFLTGYRALRPLSADEVAFIPALAGIGLVDELWWQYHQLALGDARRVTVESIEDTVLSLKWIEKNGDLLRDTLQALETSQ